MKHIQRSLSRVQNVPARLKIKRDVLCRAAVREDPSGTDSDKIDQPSSQQNNRKIGKSNMLS